MDSSSRGSESSGMASHVGEQVARTNSGGSFECNICLDLAQDPVVTLCGHLFCWPCLYEWFHVHAHSPECPVCKADVEEEKLVPIYGRGGASTAPRARSMVGVQIPSRPTGQRPSTAPRASSMAGVQIPSRPTGQRPSTAPRARSMAGVQISSRPPGQRPSTAQPPDHNHYPHQNPWFVGAGGRWGNYTFSAAIGGLFPLLNFQVHGFPQPTIYGMGLPRGFLTGMAILFTGSRVRHHRRDNRLIHT